MTEPAGDEPSYGELLSRLLKDGEGYAKARIALYREMAACYAAQARLPLILAVIAVMLAGSAIIALVVGFVIGLAALVGPVAAGAIVAFVAIALAILLLAIARRQMPDFDEIMSAGDDEGGAS